MPAEKPARSMQRSAKGSTKAGKASKAFTEEEREAIRDHVKAMKGELEGEEAVLAKIATMNEQDRTMAQRIHALMKANAPNLTPRLWYGMPAYCKDEKVICFFQPGQKFKTRYSTFGFSDKAHLDEGHMWPNSYALTELTPTEEAKIVALVNKAIS